MGIRQDQYYDLNGSATWLKRLLYLSLLMILAVALSIFAELRLIEAIANGDFASDDEMMQAAATNDARQRIIAIISLIVFISASVQTLI